MRMKKIRTASWLATAALVTAALVAPAAVHAEGNPPSVECAGYTYFLKIDGLGEGGIVAGTYKAADLGPNADWPGQEITIENVSNGGQDFDWTSTKTVSKVVAKEGSEEFSPTSGLPGTSGSVASQIQQGLSHVTFCGNEPEATQTPEPEVTQTPEPEVTQTPEPEVTQTPEPEVTQTPEPEVTKTPGPTGSVAPATGTPRVTPPATDAGIGNDASTGGLPIVLLAIAGILATSLVLLPRRRTNR